jgi:hypothetical protein
MSPVHGQFVNQAAARWYVNGAVANGVYGGAYNPYGGWGGGGTTAAESYRRGMADVMRAQGEYDVNRAKAAKEYEDARSKYIDNKTKWLQEYNQRKRIGQAQREQEQAEKREAINRGRSYRAAPRGQELPAPSQIDPDTGQIDWPQILQEPRYANSTGQLDALLQQWADGQDESVLAPQVEEATEQLQSQLHDNIRDYPANDFIAADKLLTTMQRLAASKSRNL